MYNGMVRSTWIAGLAFSALISPRQRYLHRRSLLFFYAQLHGEPLHWPCTSAPFVSAARARPSCELGGALCLQPEPTFFKRDLSNLYSQDWSWQSKLALTTAPEAILNKDEVCTARVSNLYKRKLYVCTPAAAEPNQNIHGIL